VKVAGGAYLVYLGIQMWRSRGSHPDTADAMPRGRRRSYVTALLPQLSNPKAIVVYASTLALLSPVAQIS
jgi:threonine/homoserine/homoserine lactone efflux protein